jgi:hypothetical protein
MKPKLFTVMAMALTIPGWLAAQAPLATPQIPIGTSQPANAVPSAAEVAQQLRVVMKKWTGALVNHDANALAEVLDDTYLDTDEEGTQTDKAAILALVKSGDLKLTAIQLSGLKIHSFVYAAVVTGRALQAGTFKGQKVPQAVSFTNTFAVIDGVWRVVASHRSAPHPASAPKPTATPHTK